MCNLSQERHADMDGAVEQGCHGREMSMGLYCNVSVALVKDRIWIFLQSSRAYPASPRTRFRGEAISHNATNIIEYQTKSDRAVYDQEALGLRSYFRF